MRAGRLLRAPCRLRPHEVLLRASRRARGRRRTGRRSAPRRGRRGRSPSRCGASRARGSPRGGGRGRRPASTIASSTCAANSDGTYSSQPSSPTNEARIASDGALATWISRAEKNGNPSFERSAEVRRARSSRLRGPITASVAKAAGDVGHRRGHPSAVGAEPLARAVLRGRGSEHEEPVGAQARDRPVVLDAAANVQEQRVDEPPDGDVHVVRAHVLEQPEGVADPSPRSWRTSSGRRARPPPARRGAPRRRRGTSSGARRSTRRRAPRPRARTTSVAPTARAPRSMPPAAARRSYRGERRMPRAVVACRLGQCIAYRRPRASLVRSWR